LGYSQGFEHLTMHQAAAYLVLSVRL
jgi:hypothetical protein